MKDIEFKKYAQNGLKTHLGFAPSLKDIVLYESGDNGVVVTYVLFKVIGHEHIEYQVYNSDDGLTTDICITKDESQAIWL